MKTSALILNLAIVATATVDEDTGWFNFPPKYESWLAALKVNPWPEVLDADFMKTHKTGNSN